MKEIHISKLPDRVGKLEVTEEPHRILFKLSFSRYGKLKDVSELETWLRPLFEKYDTDKRPLVIENARTGEEVAVFGDANSSLMVRIK